MGTDKRQRQKSRRDAQRAAAWAAHRRRRNLRIASAGALFVVVAVLLVVAFTAGSKNGKPKAATQSSSTPSTGSVSTTAAANTPAVAPTCPKLDGSSPPSLRFTGPPPPCLTAKAATATFDTSAGRVVVALDLAKTPATANNFAFLAGWHYYDRTNLFRVDRSIDIIQGGSPHTESASDPGPGYTIKDEGAFKTDASGQLTGPYRYQPGDLVMARSQGPDSAAAQFFFVTGPNASQLDTQGTYVVFGRVTSGLDVLQKIAAGPTKPLEGGLGETPDPPVVVRSVTISQS